jgi:hypothetical protein
MTDAEHEARYTQLESALAELRAELEQLRRPRISSMRSTGRCPSCHGRRLIHFKRVKDVAGDTTTVDLSLQKNITSFWQIVGTAAGVLEAFACRACKLVEWNAISLDDVKVEGPEVVEVEGPADVDPAGGPYR